LLQLLCTPNTKKKNCGEISRTHTPLKRNLSFSPTQDIKKPQHHHHHPAKVCNQNSCTKKQKLCSFQKETVACKLSKIQEHPTCVLLINKKARRLGRGENGPVVVRRSEEMKTGEWV
jgi:hypothetical protein